MLISGKKLFNSLIILIFCFAFVQPSWSNPMLLPDSIISKVNLLSDSERVEYLAKTGWSLRENSSELAVDMCEMALQIAIENEQERDVAQINNFIAAIYLNYLHDVSNTLPYLEDALYTSIEVDDSIQLGFAYNNLGDLYYKTNNIPLAIKYDQQSFGVFKKLNHQAGMAYSLTNLGEAYGANQEYKIALDYFFLLNEIETKRNNISGISFSLLKIGEMFFKQSNLTEAEIYFNRALEVSNKFENNTFRARCITGLANIYIVKEQHDEALVLIRKAVALNIESNYVPGIIDNKLAIALLLAHTNQDQEGVAVLLEAIELANLLGFPMYMLNAYRTKVDFFTILDDNELIIASYKEYFQVSDSLIIRQSVETINEMFKGVKAEHAIEIINEDLKKRERTSVYLAIILILILLSVFLLYWRYKTIYRLNQKLSETNSTKDKLFSIIAHDLKSPFNSILGFIDLQNSAIEEDNYKNVLETNSYIQKSASKLYVLITNLLDWARSQRGLLKMSPEPLVISTLLKQIVDVYLPEAESKGIKLLYDETDSNTIFADKCSLETVLRNLLSNAIKYSNDHSSISILSNINEESASIKVIDNGLGISKKNLARIFDISHRNVTPGVHGEFGTGLGLIVCKELIEKQNGKLKVQSEEGKGSTFEIILPSKE